MQILTMSDLRFLPHMLALHGSLAAHARRFELVVLCLDEPSRAFLTRRKLSSVEVVPLAELEREDPALARTRAERSWREYCWTATPAFCHLRLSRAQPGEIVAWIDAEIEFFRDPQDLIDELGDGSILLTPHNYVRASPCDPPAEALTEQFGRFNGGTVLLRHDDQGLAAAALWRERTVDWCFARSEPGRYGSQKHLEDFPARFSRTRVMRDPPLVLGPWIGDQYGVTIDAGGPKAGDRPICAYHFESIRLERAAPWPARRLMPNTFDVLGRAPALQARANPYYRVWAGQDRLWARYGRTLGPAIRAVLEEQPAYLGSVGRRLTRSEQMELMRIRFGPHKTRIQAAIAGRGRLPEVRGLRKGWLDPGGRSAERLRAHYEIERRLAARLRSAPAAERRALYGELYDELFRAVPDHPQLTRGEDPGHAQARIEARTGLIRTWLPAGGTFLEIGAGDCSVSHALCSYAGQVAAVEASAAVADSDAAPANFSLLASDGTSIPVARGSVDVAYSDQLLEHLHPEDALLQTTNVATALRPGGKYICLTPHRLLGPSDISAFFTDGDPEGLHLREYATGELRAMLRSAGFSRMQVLAYRRGRSIALPAGPFIVLERLFALLPRSVRARLKHTRAARLLAPGGGVIATVPDAPG